jgi:hypothetical protein
MISQCGGCGAVFIDDGTASACATHHQMILDLQRELAIANDNLKASREHVEYLQKQLAESKKRKQPEKQ